ncbi:TetR/AcrR family transcriptional regulator [Herbidospora cretacea]|uniref:TetR/AcrR family transcriptional regulator n=1 Tax=Herbidospora cretacea TaxID=28444 RepID=UPI0007735620|nr:TetR/AcrR family transcriptional regulator [Herbidospora cretacea]
MTRGGGATRDRILVEASRLFAERGYHGTSTRDIADKVGMRQPSIYSHFATKHLILAALLDADLVPARARIRAALDLPGPVAVRLHAYLQVDVAAILSLPYDVRGLYNDDVLRAPELAEQAQRRTEIHDLTRNLIDTGIEGGELVPFDTGFVQHAITGLLLEVVRERGAAPSTAPAARALDVADFVLRATLLDARPLDDVRARAGELAPHITALATLAV